MINDGHWLSWQAWWNFRKHCPSSIAMCPVLDQILTTPKYSPPTTVTQMVTASYAVSQSSLGTILTEIAKAKQMT